MNGEKNMEKRAILASQAASKRNQKAIGNWEKDIATKVRKVASTHIKSI